MLNILFKSLPALSITSTQSDAVRNLYSMITDLLQIVQLLLSSSPPWFSRPVFITFVKHLDYMLLPDSTGLEFSFNFWNVRPRP